MRLALSGVFVSKMAGMFEAHGSGKAGMCVVNCGDWSRGPTFFNW